MTFVCVYMKVKVLVAQLCLAPWSHGLEPQPAKAPLSMGFSTQEDWVGFHSLLQGIFPTRDWTQISYTAGDFFPRWLNSKECTWKGGHGLQCRRRGFHPWVGKIPWRGNGNPLQYFCLRNPRDRGAWQATWGSKELDPTERLNHTTIYPYIYTEKYMDIFKTCIFF